MSIMYINKLSIDLNDNNFKLLNDLACNEIITNIDLKCYEKAIFVMHRNVCFMLSSGTCSRKEGRIF